MQSSSTLKYRTRGNASPQGRPRVYLCCHPADFAEQLEAVAGEIIDLQTNAAIWYRDPADGPDEPISAEDLAQMQLVVVPVTARFLHEPCAARLEELPCAMEHHVPVLPLLDDMALASEFNHLCGDLQCLDRNAQEHDPTALPYRERLERFLKSVLVGDDLAARVRAAFDAYVFLSYRKRDRAQAQQVMRLIHENPLCRDIAIWYDEFLVPGEGFNQAIMDALEKSSAFALVVTPSLLQNPNYVMTTEWPAARDTGKPALPIEALPTDPARLASLYLGLGDAVSAEDREAVAARLVEVLRGIALAQHTGDPAHDYLIGLAYLSGIDVEVDQPRARELITAAASGGLPEACERLVTMYRTGEGVPRNYFAATDWQERLIKILKWVADDEPTVENRERLYRAYDELGQLKSALGNPGGAQKAYNAMLDCAISIDQMEGIEARDKVSDACTKLGELYAAEGFMDKASELFKYALDIDLELAEAAEASEGFADNMRRLAVSCRNMGEAKEYEGDLAWAQKCFEDSLRFSRLLADNEGTVADRSLLARSCSRLAEFHMKVGELDPCRPLYEEAMSVSESLEAETGSSWCRRLAAQSALDMGELCSSEGSESEALPWYEKAVGYAEQLVEQTGSVEDRALLARASRGLGTANLREGNRWQAEKLCKRSCDELSQLVLWSATRGMHMELARSWRALAGVYSHGGNTLMAADAFKKAIDADQHAQFLVPEKAQEMIAEPLTGLLSSCIGIGDVYMERREYASAFAFLGCAEDIAEELIEKTGSERTRDLLDAVREKRREAEAKMPAPEPDRAPLVAIPPAVEAPESEPVPAETPEVFWPSATVPSDPSGMEAFRGLLESYKAMGDVEKGLGNHGYAIFWYERMMGIMDCLPPEDWQDYRHNERVNACRLVGDAYLDKSFLASACAWYEQGLKINRDSGSEHSYQGELDEVALEMKLDIARKTQQEIAEKVRGFGPAPAIYDAEALKALSNDELQAVSSACLGYGHKLDSVGDREHEADWYRRSAEAEAVLAERTDAFLYSGLPTLFNNAGTLYRRLLKPAEAAYCFGRAQDIIRRIDSIPPADVWMDENGELYEPFVPTVDNEDRAIALEGLGDYRAVLELRRALAEKEQTSWQFREMSLAAYKCAAACSELDGRVAFLEEALACVKRCLELGGTERDKLFADIVARELRAWGVDVPEEGSAMRTAIVFYSLEGNTRLAATELAERLGADVFEIRATKPYPTKGPLKILVGGKDATFNACPAIEPLDIDLAAYDQLVLGTPVWADKVAAPINTFLKGRNLSGKRLALLISSASGEAGKCVQDAAAKLGIAADGLPVLSLKNPLKMDAPALSAQLDAFAAQLKG